MDKIKVKIKRIHEDAIIPRYQSIGASGFDLHALEDVELQAGETKLIRTGLAFEIPEGYELQIRPRSGLSLKTKLRVCNAPGTVDVDYRGEVCVIMENTENFLTKVIKNFKEDFEKMIQPGEHMVYPFMYIIKHLTEIFNNPISIKKGDRIAQGVICPVFQAEFVEEELTDTERGSCGMGSTGL